MANPLTTDGLDCIARKEFIAAQLLNLPERDLLAWKARECYKITA